MRLFGSLLKSTANKIEYYSKFSPSPLSIKQFLDFGKLHFKVFLLLQAQHFDLKYHILGPCIISPPLTPHETLEVVMSTYDISISLFTSCMSSVETRSAARPASAVFCNRSVDYLYVCLPANGMHRGISQRTTQKGVKRLVWACFISATHTHDNCVASWQLERQDQWSRAFAAFLLKPLCQSPLQTAALD